MKRSAVSLGGPRSERSDATRNREHLLEVVREMIDEAGVDGVTMDALAARADLGKGTVFRRFKTRAGIFQALLDEDGRLLQERILATKYGEGETKKRLIEFGKAHTTFLLEHHAIARASIDGKHSGPQDAGGFSRLYIRSLLGQAQRDGQVDIEDLDTLTIQLTAALEGPVILYLSAAPPDASHAKKVIEQLTNGWRVLIDKIVD